MRQLHYWYAQHLEDSDCYSAVGTTKKQVEEYIKENSHVEFGPIEKRVITYRNLWDLFLQVTGEGGGRGSGEKE